MAQKMIDNQRKKEIKHTSMKNVASQTGDIYEFSVCLSNHKRARLYYSESYKDYVLSLSYNSSKKFIISKSMWKKLRVFLKNIDFVLNKDATAG